MRIVFIELVDVLRCPNRHAETWLVLASEQMEERDIRSGTLGCPICKAEFPIVNGVARFGDAPRAGARGEPPDENEALRLAALLDLTDSRGYAILIGDTGRHAPLLCTMTDVQLMLVNPPPMVAMGMGISGLTADTSGALPLAPASARAVALDEHATPELLSSALGVLAPGGRLLVPVRLALPDGVTELARDDRHWLAERPSASSGIIGLSRRR
ncbi:MAG TPA: hypothetical protein VH080_07835 [Gemmatimonadaceae bacterium]|nr:hypothetical protein [Gemmatimonadaceae bacterium]